MDDYRDRTALITGGTSGIGLATARRLTEAGARVVVTGRSAQSAATAARELGPAALVVPSDTTDLTAIDSLVERVRDEVGTLDLLFLNAGITRSAALGDMTEAMFDEIMAVDVKGPYFTAQRAVPLLRKGSSIVFTTSVANGKGLPALSAYSAAKAAVRSMTRTFARDLQPAGIRVNAVSPGPIDTGILERTMSKADADAALAALVANNPMGRAGTPDEVVNAVLYLAFAATFTTGSEIVVDGGTSQL